MIACPTRLDAPMRVEFRHYSNARLASIFGRVNDFSGQHAKMPKIGCPHRLITTENGIPKQAVLGGDEAEEAVSGSVLVIVRGESVIC